MMFSLNPSMWVHRPKPTPFLLEAKISLTANLGMSSGDPSRSQRADPR